MNKVLNFFLGIFAGILITLSTSFMLNPTITISSESQSYIDINQALSHYEFSTDNSKYIEYLDIDYTPLKHLSFCFNLIRN